MRYILRFYGSAGTSVGRLDMAYKDDAGAVAIFDCIKRAFDREQGTHLAARADAQQAPA